MAKKIWVFIFIIIFTCVCSSCKSTGDDPLPPDYKLKVDFEDGFNINEDVTVMISVGISKEYQEDYSQWEELKMELGYAPLKKGGIFGDKANLFYTIIDFSDDKYYYTEEENEIIYHFTDKYSIPKEFFSETYFFSDSYGEFCIFLGIPNPTVKNDWSFAMLKSYVYEKQGSTLLIQKKGDYKYEDYSLKVDLEDKYNLDEDVALTISIGIHQKFHENFSQNKNYKMGLAYAPREFRNIYYNDQITLYHIADFSDDRYFYTKENDEIIYHFSEQFKIDKEVFNKDTGMFCIYLWRTDSNGEHCFVETVGAINFYYEKQNGFITISQSYVWRGNYEE